MRSVLVAFVLGCCGSLLGASACKDLKQGATLPGASEAGADDASTSVGIDADDPSLPQTSCTTTSPSSLQPLGLASHYSVNASFAWGGDSMAVVWEVGAIADGGIDPPPIPGTLYFAKVDDLGLVSAPVSLGQGDDPALLRVNNELILFYRDADTLKSARLADDGTLKEPVSKVYGPTLGGGTSAVWLGDGYAIALDGAGDLQYEAHLLLLDENRVKKGAPTRFAQAGINSLQPSLAWNGTELAAMWTDARESLPEVYFARFSKDGARLSDDQRVSDSSIRGSFPTLTAQAAGGWLGCWEALLGDKNQQIFCGRLDGDGTLTKKVRVTNTSDDALSPQVVSHGRDTWVFWDDHTGATPVIQQQFLDQEGTPLLVKPSTTEMPGWRAHGAIHDNRLYLSVYETEDGTNWKALAATLNCW